MSNEEQRVTFPGGGQRGSDETFYSDVSEEFLDCVMNSGQIDIEEYAWDHILNDMGRIAQAKEPYYDFIVYACQRIRVLAGLSEIDIRFNIADTLTYGAKKYPRNNWKMAREDGTPSIPVSNWMNHAIKHILKYREGNTQEPHLARALCNLYMAWWVLKFPEKMIPCDSEDKRGESALYCVSYCNVSGEYAMVVYQSFNLAMSYAKCRISEYRDSYLQDSTPETWKIQMRDDDTRYWQSPDGKTLIFIVTHI